VQASGSENRITLHLPDGPEQLARDAQFLESASGSNPDKWSDRETQQFLWGWDAEKVALEAWNSMYPCPDAWCPRLMRFVSKDLVEETKVKPSL
jgi:hypothetical protein